MNLGAHGGRRSGSGRKPIEDTEKKVQVSLYIKQKDLAQLGGKEGVIKILEKNLKKSLDN